MFFFALISCSALSLAAAQSGYGCPEKYGVQTYPHEKYCDSFYKVRFFAQIIIQSKARAAKNVLRMRVHVNPSKDTF